MRDWLEYGFRAAPRLETERLVLRGFETRDIEPLCAIMREPAVTRYFGGNPMPHEDTRRRMLGSVGGWMLLGLGFWAVTRKNDGRLVGQAGLLALDRNMPDPRNDNPEMGWLFATEAQGQGLAHEACCAILDWTRDCLGNPDLWAMISPDNAPSIALAKKLGFVADGESVLGGEPIGLWLRRAG